MKTEDRHELFRGWRYSAINRLEETKMSDKKKPGSWFSVWAGKLGIPTYVVWMAAVVVGVLAFFALRGAGLF